MAMQHLRSHHARIRRRGRRRRRPRLGPVRREDSADLRHDGSHGRRHGAEVPSRYCFLDSLTGSCGCEIKSDI